MIISHINQYHKGWFVGDFSPALYKNKEFEIAHHRHKMGEQTFSHFHQLTTELNYIIKGKLKVSWHILQEGDIWIYQPGDVSDVEFLSDSELIVVRWPSIPTDKYEANRP